MKIVVDKNTEKGKTTFRRLILTKRLYLHGLEHSLQLGALDKMIAVHNFHNAIEIALRAIILHYEIRLEKELNITFENMLNEIESKTKTKLPYRQEIRNLNGLRNMVQHHAVEPESSTMEDWRVFSKRFLIKVCEQYFDISFDKLTSIDFINDKKLYYILKNAETMLNNSNWKEAIIQSKMAFIHASKSIIRFLPHRTSHSPLRRIIDCRPQILTGYASNDLKILKWQFEQVDNIVDDIYQAINEKHFHSSILSTGINISDIKKYNEIQPVIELSLSGNPEVFGGNSCCEDDAHWIYNFVSESIIKWQLSGLEPIAEVEK